MLLRASTIYLLVVSSVWAQGTLEDDLARAIQKSSSDNSATAPSEASQYAQQAAIEYQAGRLESAVKFFDRAAGEAYKLGAKGSAFEYALAAAEIQRTRRAWLDAAVRFRRVALRAANDPRAVAAHFTACEAMASLLLQGSETDELIIKYDQLLDEHLKAWPRSPHVQKIEWLRVELLAIRKEWSQLIEVINGVPKSHPRYDRSLELLVTAHQHLLDRASSKDFPNQLANATTDLQLIILGSQGLWPTKWTPLQRQVALVLAEAHVKREEGGIDYARRLLRVALHEASTSHETWKLKATSLLTLCEVSLGNQTEADQRLATILNAPAETRAKLLSNARQRIVSRQSTLIDELDRLLASIQAFTGSQNLSSAKRADALSNSGSHAEAVEIYEKLIQESPGNRSLLVARARELESAGQHEQALQAWHQIEARTARATLPWFEARLERLRLLVLLSRREEAEKLIRLTKLTTPSLGGELLSKQYAKLEQMLLDQ